MSTKYTLNVVNKSESNASFVIFQKNPNIENANPLTLAWQTQTFHDNNSIDFQWETSYDLVWGESKELKHGVNFQETSSQKRFAISHDGEIQLKKLHQEAVANNSIPEGAQSIGVAMGGAPVFAMAADSNMDATIDTKPEYWIAHGKFNAGDVIDTDAIENSVRIHFDEGTNSKRVTLKEDETWSIE